jgi:hypothetical protein
MEGLVAWMRDPRFKEIVFVKNCSLEIRHGILEKAAEAYGKRLEVLQVGSSPLTLQRGKGFGEGDMVRQTLEKSLILAHAQSFCKVTGKLFYERDALFEMHGRSGMFHVVSAQAAGLLVGLRRRLGVFYRSRHISGWLPFLHKNFGLPWSLLAAAPEYWIDTRFHHVSKKVYRERLLASHLRVHDAMG